VCVEKFTHPYPYIDSDANLDNMKYALDIPQGHCGFISIKKIVKKVSEVSLKELLQFETILRTLNIELLSVSGGTVPRPLLLDHLAPQKRIPYSQSCI